MSTTQQTPIGYGLVGGGAFGRYCMEQYKQLDQLDQLKLIAVTDIDAEAGKTSAEAFDLVFCETYDELLSRDDIDLVHLATPPSSHRELAIKAAEAGKHVLCEKPLAVTLEDGQAMLEAAREAGCLLSVNLIMRYNPFAEIVKAIVDERLLGAPLHGFFENYAQDEGLGPDHWFWNLEASGGIFVEHAVHFFDLVRYWLGPGTVVAAQTSSRTNTGVQDQVHATVRYGDEVLFNHYHGFHQAVRMEKQELRLVFERGSLSLYEWIPTSLHLDGLLDEAGLKRLKDLMPTAQPDIVSTFTGDDRQLHNRHSRAEVDYHVVLEYDTGCDKPELYSQMVRDLMADQVRAIRRDGYKPRVGPDNGLQTLEMATEAVRLSR